MKVAVIIYVKIFKSVFISLMSHWPIILRISQSIDVFFFVWFIVFNATFNNISVISWRSVILVEETRTAEENHRPDIDKLYHIMRYRVHLAWTGFKLTTSVLIRHWLHNLLILTVSLREIKGTMTKLPIINNQTNQGCVQYRSS